MEEQEQREEQKRFNEMDITVRVGYPFKQTVHYTAGESNRLKKAQYLTKMPPKELLEKKVLLAIANAREQLEQRKQ